MNGPFPQPRLHGGFPCHGCGDVTGLCKLNDDMLCVSCGEPEEDPETTYDPSPAAMLREHGTWRL